MEILNNFVLIEPILDKIHETTITLHTKHFKKGKIMMIPKRHSVNYPVGSIILYDADEAYAFTQDGKICDIVQVEKIIMRM